MTLKKICCSLKYMGVSVIIPTFYSPYTLKISLQSIVKQTLKPKEVIIIDNSIEKKSKIIVEDLKKKLDLKIIYKHLTKDPNQTRNYASKCAGSKYLAFLDDDDTWEKNYLLNCVNLINNSDADFLYTNINIIDEIGKKISFVDLPNKINLKDLFCYNGGFFCSNFFIKRKIFLLMGGFDTNSGSADKDLAIRLVKNKFNYQINNSRIVNKRVSNYQWSNNCLSMIKNNFLFFKRYKKEVDILTKILFFKKIINLFFRHIKKINNPKQFFL